MMNGISAAATAAVCAATLLSCVVTGPKTTEPRPRTITVRGTGTVQAVADTASITFTVVTQEWVAKTASESNAEITARVYSAIVAAGVSADDINTQDINIYRQDTYSNGRSYPGRYRVSNSIAVSIRNVDKASVVIDAAVAAGAGELSGLSFSVSDTSDLLRQARTKAIQDAQATAALLAGASGCKIGEPVAIVEGGGGAPVPAVRFGANTAMAASSDGAAATPVSEGKVAVTAEVTITYLLL